MTLWVQTKVINGVQAKCVLFKNIREENMSVHEGCFSKVVWSAIL